jgi:hypothetical protein
MRWHPDLRPLARRRHLTKGKKPFGTDILNRYMERVIQAGQVDDDVVIRFNEVVALVRSPQTLLTPSFVLRVLARARRADRAQVRAWP